MYPKYYEMDYFLDLIYWSISIWPIGYLFAVPFGSFLYGGWFAFVAFWTFFEIFMGKGDFWEWIAGPFRQYAVGSLIFSIALFNGIIPGWGILTSGLCAWWANSDYMDYQDYA